MEVSLESRWVSSWKGGSSFEIDELRNFLHLNPFYDIIGPFLPSGPVQLWWKSLSKQFFSFFIPFPFYSPALMDFSLFFLGRFLVFFFLQRLEALLRQIAKGNQKVGYVHLLNNRINCAFQSQFMYSNHINHANHINQVNKSHTIIGFLDTEVYACMYSFV